MKAVVFAGEGRVALDQVDAPRIQEPGDAIVRVTKASICGSDLHVLDGKTPGMRVGGVLGHEFVGVVEESSGTAAAEGARVLGSFLIACGECSQCRARRFNFCKNRRALGLGPLAGDLEGSQAELVRVPNASLNLHPLTSLDADDEKVLFAGDILATGFFAAEVAGTQRGDSVVVVGAGPVGLCTAMALKTRDPGLLLVLDADPHRVAFARSIGFESLDVGEMDAQAAVAGRTDGAMADATIDAVGSIPAFKSAMKCARDGGRVAVIGVYGAERYEFPMGMAWIRGLDIRFSGMANVHAHWDEALQEIEAGRVDPTRMVTHHLSLDEAEEGYRLFAEREAVKVVLTV
jgi:threonine dehydrogenase-like Zn-dependent dehydrogenase